MGCGCQNKPAPVAAGGAALRSFVVEPDRIREVTGMVLPDAHQRAAYALAEQRSFAAERDYQHELQAAVDMAHSGQASSQDPLASARDASLLPSLAFGGLAGVILGRTLLFGSVGLPVALALGALGVAAYNAGGGLFGCSCSGFPLGQQGDCIGVPGGTPDCSQNLQGCVDDCARSGTTIGAAAGVGAGLLLELWSRRFPLRSFFMHV
jgi:hypothetical protein